MATPETETGPLLPERDGTAAWQPSRTEAATVSVPTGSTPGPGRHDHSTASVTTGAPIPVTPVPVTEFPDIPGYEIQAVVGRGGMGVVYRALHRELGRVVALKLISPGGRDETALRVRFEREIRALSRIEHPNVVPVYDAGQWHGFPYFTMKHVPGGTLAHHLDRFQGDPAAACRLVAKVARAVGRLHAEGVLHRDLKPLNILLGDGGEPLVADFGLAWWMGTESDLTATGAPLGTRQYMAPEQTLGQKASYSPACDVWALGVILYELLTGRRPFAADDPVELYRLIRAENPPPGSTLNPHVTPALDGILSRCLAKSPDGRYATADALATDLERWLAGETISIPPRVVRRPWYRRRGRMVAGVLVLLAAAAGGWRIAGMPGAPADRPQQGEEPTVPALSPAELLAAGQPVEFIGAKGLPQVLGMPGGHRGTVAENRDGFCEVGTAGWALIELWVGPLRTPFTLEAEVAVTAEGSSSDAGIYFGRHEWETPNGKAQAFLAAMSNGPPKPLVVGPDNPRTGYSTMKTVLLRPQEPVQMVTELTTPVRFAQPPAGHNRSPHWQPLRIRVEAAEIRLQLSGAEVAPIPMARALDRMRFLATTAPADPAIQHPAAHSGLGLYVDKGRALFRNVRLIPDPQ